MRRQFLKAVSFMTFAFLVSVNLSMNVAAAPPAAIGPVRFPGNKIQQFAQPLPLLDAAGGTIQTILDDGSEIPIRMVELRSNILPPSFKPANSLPYAGTAVFTYRVSEDPATPLTSVDVNGNGEMDEANEVVIPLDIQDRMFDTNGELFFPSIGINPEHPYWVPEFVGDTIVVNGKAWPYLNVDQQGYRFFAINGSNSRPYNMFLQDLTSKIKYPMWVISTDGGYLDKPVLIDPNANAAQVRAGAQKRLMMMPGERYEIIIDFAGIPAGTNIVLRNDAPTVDGNPKASLDGRIMQFRVTANAPATDMSYDPSTLEPIRTDAPIVRLPGTPGGPAISSSNVDMTRLLTLNEVLGVNGPLEALVNNTKWSGMREDHSMVSGSVMYDGPNQDAFSFMGNYLTELPEEGSTEVWEIVNLTMDSHPIHLHGLQFQLIDRQMFDMKAYMMSYGMAFMNDIGAIDPLTGLPYPDGVYIPGYGPPLDYLTGNPRALGGNPDPVMMGMPMAPLAYEEGWKDTVIMHPGEKTRIAVRVAPTDKALDDPDLYW
ncbi:MAG: multicopper oxidase domain-containing protein, partial [Youngiibacter sp.]|nr:multicopper oxidase domain-containing protein [Youngiibacter sp.]